MQEERRFTGVGGVTERGDFLGVIILNLSQSPYLAGALISKYNPCSVVIKITREAI